jgi:hypothetical protein
MDKKTIIVIAIITLLIIGWFPLVNKIWPPKPAPAQTNTVFSATNKLTNVPPNAQTNGAASAAATPKDADTLPLPAGAEEKLEILETENLRYVFSSFGGGIKEGRFKTLSTHC